MKPDVKKILKFSQTGAFLVSSLTNIRYLSDFSGTSAMILYHKLYSKPFFITDSRYTLIAQKKIKGFKIIETDDVSGTISVLCKDLKRATLGYNGKNLTCSSLSSYRKKIKNLCFKDCGDIIAEFRAIKTAEEIKKIRKAVTIADDIFLHIRRFIKPGRTEREIKNRIDDLIYRSQAESASFPVIVASGPNSAMPHYYESKRKVLENDIILVDMGVVYKGYSSDLTRVVFTGKIKPLFRNIYRIVARASEEAFKAVKTGIKASEIDKAARDYINKSGFGRYFGHNTGHGIGLEVHEFPIISQKSNTKLKNGNVFTIEPGIYLPGKGGVRIENMVSVKNEKPVLLTDSPIPDI